MLVFGKSISPKQLAVNIILILCVLFLVISSLPNVVWQWFGL